MVDDLTNCGYDPDRISETLDKVKEREINPVVKEASTQETLALVVPYFQELGELKSFLHSLDKDITVLTGKETKTLVASRKGVSVGSRAVKNRQLCEEAPEADHRVGQQCGAKGCRTCPVICGDTNPLVIEGRDIVPQEGLTCKSKNIIYMAQCTLCDTNPNGGELSVYAGQTTQPLHKRINGHRACFNMSSESQAWEKSALSLHAYEEHRDNFSMSNYRILAVRQCPPTSLNRFESKTINDYRLGVLGLNRMKIQK